MIRPRIYAAALAFGIASSAPIAAKDVMKTETAGAYRIELHVLPAEPFFTADEVAAKHVMMGMLIEGGAAPVAPDANSHPNHHLVVHVFDRKTGQVLSDAKVTLSFEPLDSKGKSARASTEVPVVVMQAIGAGPKSTHYGNNVVMPAGPYRVTRDGQRREGDVCRFGIRHCGDADGADENVARHAGASAI